MNGNDRSTAEPLPVARPLPGSPQRTSGVDVPDQRRYRGEAEALPIAVPTLAVGHGNDGRPHVRILLCEDNKGDYLLLKARLDQIERCHFDIDWTQTFDDSISALRRDAHDLAIVDYLLIGGSGHDILREAAAIGWQAPIIMLTNHNDPDIDFQSTKLGASDFLCKDELTPAMLERSIRYSIENKRMAMAVSQTNKEYLDRIVELRTANDEIEAQSKRILSLAYHLASTADDTGRGGRAATSIVSRVGSNDAEHLGVWHFDHDGHTLHANPVVLGLFEVAGVEALAGRGFDALLTDDSTQRLHGAFRNLGPHAALTIELELIGQASGRRSWVVMSLLPRSDDGGEPKLMATVVDITNRRNAEQATLFQARHDSLTGVANRIAFQEDLDHATAIARRNGSLVGLLCVDLDRFKRVNDTHGHQAGDKLLCQAATRLSDLTRKSDTVARLGGDEFGVITTNLERCADVETIAGKIAKAFDSPFTVRDREISCGASVGFAVFPKDCENLEELFDRADAAMYRSKCGQR